MYQTKWYHIISGYRRNKKVWSKNKDKDEDSRLEIREYLKIISKENVDMNIAKKRRKVRGGGEKNILTATWQLRNVFYILLRMNE